MAYTKGILFPIRLVISYLVDWSRYNVPFLTQSQSSGLAPFSQQMQFGRNGLTQAECGEREVGPYTGLAGLRAKKAIQLFPKARK